MKTLTQLRLLGVLALGCHNDADTTDGPAETSSSGPASSDTLPGGLTSSGTTGSPSDSTNLDGTGPDADTGADTGEATTASDTNAEASSGVTAESGEQPGELCGLTVIDPTTDPETVVDAGDQPGQIPAAIGDALVRNCGCHYTDNVRGYTDYISNAAPLSTWDDFHAPFAGAFPAGFDDQPTWRACELRVVFQQPLPMPPNDCRVDGESGFITHDDFVLFAQWFEAGAPDGANFP